MAKYYIQLVNDELPEPRYVERGLGIGGVKLTDDLRAAKRYDTEAEAEKIAALARVQKDKERGGEMTTVQIVTEGGSEAGDGWETRFRFEQCSTGAETLFQMKKTADGIMSRYVTFNGNISPERPAAEMDKCFVAWTDCVRAWAHARITQKEARR